MGIVIGYLVAFGVAATVDGDGKGSGSSLAVERLVYLVFWFCFGADVSPGVAAWRGRVSSRCGGRLWSCICWQEENVEQKKQNYGLPVDGGM